MCEDDLGERSDSEEEYEADSWLTDGDGGSTAGDISTKAGDDVVKQKVWDVASSRASANKRKRRILTKRSRSPGSDKSNDSDCQPRQQTRKPSNVLNFSRSRSKSAPVPGNQPLIDSIFKQQQSQPKTPSYLEDNTRVYLNTSFAERNEVKVLGALWDAENKKWWVPSTANLAKLQKWIIQDQASVRELAKKKVDTCFLLM